MFGFSSFFFPGKESGIEVVWSHLNVLKFSAIFQNFILRIFTMMSIHLMVVVCIVMAIVYILFHG